MPTGKEIKKNNGEADLLMHSGEKILGIDIGTTTISATVIDVENRVQLKSYTIENGSACSTSDSSFCEQSPDIICEKVIRLLEQIIRDFDRIKVIGVTGQMHGIVYIDKSGNAVSPLMTWQDRRAAQTYEGERSYCDRIFDIIHRRIPSGYGFATHYYNCINHLVSAKAHSFCSIMDYVIMKLTKQPAPLIHSSVAASFGLFDLEKRAFDGSAIRKLGIDNLQLPKVTDEFLLVGTYENIPVAAAIGDNQASFIGSVRDIGSTILINIGTGSQLSMLADSDISETYGMYEELELRPLVKNEYIFCGSALCGGAAYALLERFFRSYVAAAGYADSAQYDVMNKLLVEAYHQKKEPLIVNTCFCGKRNIPNLTGFILNVTNENFTPEQLVLGVIDGICQELHGFLRNQYGDKKLIVASGNAVQKIPLMKTMLEKKFLLPVQISEQKEEASVGAALFAAIAAGIIKDIYEASEFVG